MRNIPNSPIDIAARTAWGEARGEGSLGMQAVLNVISNRVLHPGWWGNDVISVCLKPWQFSCWNTSDPNRDKILEIPENDPEYRTAINLSEKMVSGELKDITLGADSYYALSSMEPKWAKKLKPTAIIGGQAFYVTRDHK